MKFISTCFLLIFAGICFAETNLTLGTLESGESSILTSIQKFSDTVQDKSGGQIKVKIFPGGSFGGIDTHIDDVITGALDMAVIPTMALSGRYNKLQILELPFLFSSESLSSSYEIIDTFLYRPDSKGRNLYRLPDTEMIKGLAFFEYGLEGIATKNRAIKKVKDYQGIKVKSLPSQLIAGSFNSLGASPVVISAAEVFSALQTGLIEATLSTPIQMYQMKYFEVLKYYSLTSQAYLSAIFIINRNKFDSLPDKYRKIITDTASEVSSFQRESSRSIERDSIERLTKFGVEVIRSVDYISMRETSSKQYAELKSKLIDCSSCDDLFPLCCLWFW